MADKRLHTPDGVRDLYGAECMKKAAVQEKITRVFHLCGYEDIETPTFEFFDIFNDSRGSVPSKEMFKFFDRDNHTLVLRPDETPAIARCVTKYFMEEDMPLRLCYRERTFKNNTSYQGRLKEATQTGAELIGDNTADGDAEMIAMVIRSLKAAGLTEFQVELGEVEFFRGLLDEAGLDEDTSLELRRLIENKNYFGVEELMMAQKAPESLKQVFLKLPELFGPLGQITTVKALTTNQRALRSIARLEEIHEILDLYGLSEYVSYDLGMLSQYEYYTGVIFKAYTYGTGDYIVNGGRYDKLLVQFGKDAPAVGFAISVDELMLALSRQKVEIPITMAGTMILFEKASRSQAIRLADHFRGNEMALSLICREDGRTVGAYRTYAARSGYRNLLYLDEQALVVRVINVMMDSTDEIPLSEYLKEG